MFCQKRVFHVVHDRLCRRHELGICDWYLSGAVWDSSIARIHGANVVVSFPWRLYKDMKIVDWTICELREMWLRLV